MRYDKDGLTAREREIYDYIVTFKKVNGYSPSHSEIAKGCYTSRSYVQRTLEKLSDLELIRYNEKKYRSIVVLKFLDSSGLTLLSD